MAVNKVISNKATTHQQLRNCIAYALRSEKVKEGYTSITGPYAYDSIDSKNVFNSFIDEKKLWNKDSGRMYMHSIISWHKNEKLTPDLALKIATNIAEHDPFYKDFQTLVAIHQDKNHIHAHLVTNTVSYKDGRKEHHSTSDIKGLMARTNEYCASYGLSVTKSGQNFEGQEIRDLEISSMSNNKYRLLLNDTKKSYLVECMVAVDNTMHIATSKEHFIRLMKQNGWDVLWNEDRKYITFSDVDGHKVRNSNLSKTFNVDLSKEALEYEFEKQKRCGVEETISFNNESIHFDEKADVGDAIRQGMFTGIIDMSNYAKYKVSKIKTQNDIEQTRCSRSCRL